MVNDKKETKKELKEFKQSTPQQLKLFELADGNRDDYSNTVELYDMMPKYFIGGVRRDIGKNVDSLPILEREFKHKGQGYKLNISPAALINKKTGKTVHYLPSQREELVEDVIRKLAAKKRGIFLDNDAAVKFTLYEVEKELKKMGHGYNLNEIKDAINICSKSIVEITSQGNGDVSISSTIFPFVGMENDERIKDGKNRIVVMFHPLVTKSINEGTYRLVNYEKIMCYKMPLSRWLYKRMSHNFIQAGVDNPYKIKLSTIVRDSGMKRYNKNSDSIRQISKAMDEIQNDGTLIKYEVDKQFEGRGIVDAIFELYVSEEFVSDVKKANQLSRRIKPIEQGLIIDDVRTEIQKPIYNLSQKEIEEFLDNIKTQKEKERFMNALMATQECIIRNKDYNPSATLKKAIKDKWSPTSKYNSNQSNLKLVNPSDEKSEKEIDIKLDNQNKVWKKIDKILKKKFTKEIYDQWLSKLNFVKIEDNQLLLATKTKFLRDWIIREYIQKDNMLNYIQDVESEIGNIKVISLES